VGALQISGAVKPRFRQLAPMSFFDFYLGIFTRSHASACVVGPKRSEGLHLCFVEAGDLDGNFIPIGDGSVFLGDFEAKVAASGGAEFPDGIAVGAGVDQKMIDAVDLQLEGLGIPVEFPLREGNDDVTREQSGRGNEKKRAKKYAEAERSGDGAKAG
jgi:hypothetical protein